MAPFGSKELDITLALGGSAGYSVCPQWHHGLWTIYLQTAAQTVDPVWPLVVICTPHIIMAPSRTQLWGLKPGWFTLLLALLPQAHLL